MSYELAYKHTDGRKDIPTIKNSNLKHLVYSGFKNKNLWLRRPRYTENLSCYVVTDEVISYVDIILSVIRDVCV